MSSKTTGFQPRPKLFDKGPRVTDSYQKQQTKGSRLKYSHLIVFDVVIFNICIIVTMLHKISIYDSWESLRTLPLFLLTSNILWILVATFSDIYRGFDQSAPLLKMKDLFSGSLIYFGTLSLLNNLLFPNIYDFQFLIEALISFLVLASLMHHGFRTYYKKHSDLLLYSVAGGTSEDLNYLDRLFQETYGVNSFCVGRFSDTSLAGVIRLGSYGDIWRYIKLNPDNIAKFIYINSGLTRKEIQQIARLCRLQFIEFEVIPNDFRLFEKGVQVEQLAHLPIFRRKKEPLHQLKNQILKRTFDLVFSLIVTLLIFPWLIPIIAFLIKMESPGPVFFIQVRSGYWNRPFKMLKFRTMRLNIESDRLQASRGDERITRIGLILRKTSLDELPQFLNVLMGDMSIVGPRPHMLKHTSEYSKLITSFMIRHEVKPGITGWAQVSGWRGQTDLLYKMAKRVEYDVNYIEGWNIWFDLKCIWMTVGNMMKGDNNAV